MISSTMKGLMLVTFFNLVLHQIHAENEHNNWSKANFDTLQLVQVIMRHGDRNPMGSYPMDPHKDDPNYFPEGYGQLTDRGVKQTNSLGRFARQRYDGFLGRRYHSDEVYAISSDSDRSIRSGNSFLRGLYPKKYENQADHGSSDEKSIYHSDENCPVELDDGEQSQIVPIRTINRDVDNFLYLAFEVCPKWEKEYMGLLKTEIMKLMISLGGDKMGPLMKHAGIKEHGLQSTGVLLDHLLVLKHQNKPLPEWATPEVFDFAKHLFQFVFSLETKTPSLKQMRSAIIQKLFNNIEKKLNSPEEERRKLMLFSAHDRTIVGLLNILGMYNNRIPPYASGVFIELHKDPELPEQHLEFYFRNDTSVEPHQLTSESCGTPCLLSNFKEIVQNLVPEDFTKACAL